MIKKINIKPFDDYVRRDSNSDELFYIELITDDDLLNQTKEIAEELNLICEDYIIKLIQNGAIYIEYEGFFFDNEDDCQEFIDTIISPLIKENDNLEENEDVFSCENYNDYHWRDCFYIKIENIIKDRDIIKLLKISKNKYNEIMEDNDGEEVTKNDCDNCDNDGCCELPKFGYYFDDKGDCKNAIKELKKYYINTKEKIETKKEVEKSNQNIKQSRTRKINIIE